MYNRKSRSHVVENVKVITGELQYNLVTVGVDKKQQQKTKWKPESEKRNVAKLRDEPYKQIFECRVQEIMSDNNSIYGDLLKVC